MRSAGAALSAALLTLTTLSACGGGDSAAQKASAEDQAGIERAAATVATTYDGNAAETCKTWLSQHFVTSLYKNQKNCAEPSDTSKKDAATGATVAELTVDGDAATAVVTHVGGETAGATGHWTFVRDGAQWRVDDWQTDFLRSYFSTGFGDNYDSDGADDPLGIPAVRACLVQKFTSLDDTAFRALMVSLFQQSGAAFGRLQDAVLDCMTEAPSDGSGISAMRQLFERGLKLAAAKDKNGVVSVKVADCVAKKLRKTLSDADIRSATENYLTGPGGDDPSKYYSKPMIAAIQKASLDCYQETPA